jgi:hypothetical protein
MDMRTQIGGTYTPSYSLHGLDEDPPPSFSNTSILDLLYLNL